MLILRLEQENVYKGTYTDEEGAQLFQPWSGGYQSAEVLNVQKHGYRIIQTEYNCDNQADFLCFFHFIHLFYFMKIFRNYE